MLSLLTFILTKLQNKLIYESFKEILTAFKLSVLLNCKTNWLNYKANCLKTLLIRKLKFNCKYF